MGRSPCCDESGLKKGPWTPEEDEQLVDYISRHGHGSWRALPKLAGLNRCGKSCRLRWTNYLRPDIKRGSFSDNEERLIINLHSVLGNKWSAIATRLPGRTDNEIKNFWNTHLKKKLLKHGIDPITHKPRTDLNNILGSLTSLFSNNPNGVVNLMSPLDMNAQRLQADAAQLAKLQIMQSLIHVLTQKSTAKFGGDNLNYLPFNGLLDSSTCCTQHPCPKPSSLTNFSSQQFSANDYNLSEILDSCACLEEQGPSAPMNGNADSKMMMGTNCYNNYNNGNNLNCSNYHMKSLDAMPSLISASPEHNSMHQMIKEETIRNGDSTHSSTSTLFEGWGDYTLDGQASDYCWTDIMEQASSSSNWAMGA